jgi:hypothetical protein
MFSISTSTGFSLMVRGRHFMDVWLLTEGYATEDNHGPVEIEDAICAQLFNLMGRLHEILKEKL